jgi:hypothetical protein
LIFLQSCIEKVILFSRVFVLTLFIRLYIVYIFLFDIRGRIISLARYYNCFRLNCFQAEFFENKTQARVVEFSFRISFKIKRLQKRRVTIFHSYMNICDLNSEIVLDSSDVSFKIACLLFSLFLRFTIFIKFIHFIRKLLREVYFGLLDVFIKYFNQFVLFEFA